MLFFLILYHLDIFYIALSESFEVEKNYISLIFDFKIN